MPEASQPIHVKVDDVLYELSAEKNGGMARVLILDRKDSTQWDPIFRQRIAVKVFDPDGSAGLEDQKICNELSVWIALDHPAIVPLRKIVRVNWRIGALMPAYRMCLSQRIRCDGPLSVKDSIDVGIQICEALEHARTKHATLHLDIKPANVLINFRENNSLACHLSDWGIATIHRDLAEARSVPGKDFLRDFTHTYVGFGTFPYMAPERFLEGARATTQCDIYSVGVLLLEAMTGTTHTDSNPEDHIGAALAGRYFARVSQLMERYPQSLSKLVLRCICPDQAERFASPLEVAIALKQCDSFWGRLTRNLRKHN